MKWDRRKRFLLFGLYEYVTFLEQKIVDLCPQFLRNIYWRLRLGSYGTGNMVAYGVYFRYPSKMYLGNNVAINRNCSFYNSQHIKDAKIILEDNVTIGPEVSFFVAGHDYSKLNLPDIAETIHVGKNVWIGGKAVICPGTKIGEAAVVAAGAVVTKDVPSFAVVGGNPARVIKNRAVEGDRATI